MEIRDGPKSNDMHPYKEGDGKEIKYGRTKTDLYRTMQTQAKEQPAVNSC